MMSISPSPVISPAVQAYSRLPSIPADNPVTPRPVLSVTPAAAAAQRSEPASTGSSVETAPAAGSDDLAVSAQQRQQLARVEAEQQRLIQAEVRSLASRDREVRAHEQAHLAVGGQYAGTVRYDYTRGPDGRLYAVGGSVSIDTAPVPGDPEATVEKLQQVQRAALAPAQPSSQDLAIAAQAAQIIAQARAEIATQSQSDPQDDASADVEPEADASVSRAGANSDKELALYRQIADERTPLSELSLQA